MNILDCAPKAVWKYFSEISSIPRGSGNEAGIREYIKNLAESSGLDYAIDDAGNILVKKPANNACPSAPAVVLQGHLDMVCEKLSDSPHNFSTDKLLLIVDGDFLKADKTTLGADNGIGIAMSLALLFSDEYTHGPLEALFTVEEETGLIGASNLGPDMCKGKILINLDTEEEGEFYIGCAGGKIVRAACRTDSVPAPEGYAGILIEAKGLHGGHSGMEIDKGYGNALLCALEIAEKLSAEHGFILSEINAPGKHNAIPRECRIAGIVPEDKIEDVLNEGEKLSDDIRKDYSGTDPDMRLSCIKINSPARVIKPSQSRVLISCLSSLPHGVIDVRRDVTGLVNTSVNFATAESMPEEIEITVSQRSFAKHAINFAARKMINILELGGFVSEIITQYPNWDPNQNSKLLNLCLEIWKKMYNAEAEIKAVHAGLECGIIGEILGGMDMISIGPDLFNAHTPDECVSIKSVARVWTFLLEILKQIAEGKLSR